MSEQKDYIIVKYGETKNLGNYESQRLDISIGKVVEGESYDYSYCALNDPRT